MLDGAACARGRGRAHRRSTERRSPPPATTRPRSRCSVRHEQTPAHAARDGFRCATSARPARPAGFGYGYTGRARPVVERAGSPRTRPRPVGRRVARRPLRVVALAVDPARAGPRLRAALQDALLLDLPHARALLTTYRDDRPAPRLYRRLGWTLLAAGVFARQRPVGPRPQACSVTHGDTDARNDTSGDDPARSDVCSGGAGRQVGPVHLPRTDRSLDEHPDHCHSGPRDRRRPRHPAVRPVGPCALEAHTPKAAHSLSERAAFAMSVLVPMHQPTIRAGDGLGAGFGTIALPCTNKSAHRLMRPVPVRPMVAPLVAIGRVCAGARIVRAPSEAMTHRGVWSPSARWRARGETGARDSYGRSTGEHEEHHQDRGLRRDDGGWRCPRRGGRDRHGGVVLRQQERHRRRFHRAAAAEHDGRVPDVRQPGARASTRRAISTSTSTGTTAPTRRLADVQPLGPRLREVHRG